MGFAKAQHQIPPKKSGRGPGLRERHKILEFPLNIFAVVEVAMAVSSGREDDRPVGLAGT